MAIRDEVVAEENPKRRAGLKSEHLRALWAAEWPTIGKLTVTRGDWTIVFDERPEVVRGRDGDIIGIDATVRVFQDGEELRVDPHRICINPPLLVPDGADGFELNPREAYLQWLESSLRDTPNPSGWRTRGTVTTVYATGPGGNGSLASQHASYATARTGGSIAAMGDHGIGQAETGGGTLYTCYESFLIFDTSGIPDGDTVTAVVLSLDGAADFTDTEFNVKVAASSYNGGPVVSGDWVSGADLSALTELATWDTTGYSTGYNAFTETADFKAAINKTGNTALIVFSDLHASGTTPSGSEFLVFTDADPVGTTNDAKLDITHAGAAVTGTATASIDEADVVAGGETIIITLTGATWVAD